MMKFHFSIFLFLFPIVVFAQNTSAGFVKSKSNECIPYAYIENVSNQTIVQASKIGEFSIESNIGDTLLISSIGYCWKKYIVTSHNLLTIELELNIQSIAEVRVSAFGTYQDFTRKIVSMEAVEDTLHIDIEPISYTSVNNYTPGQIGTTISAPITEIYNTLNKHAKNLKLAQELHNNKHIVIYANKKLNTEIIYDVTKIPTKYIEEFIVFCKYSDVYLASHTEYEIIMDLYGKYELFKGIHPELSQL